jgi:hypothetical protein
MKTLKVDILLPRATTHLRATMYLVKEFQPSMVKIDIRYLGWICPT